MLIGITKFTEANNSSEETERNYLVKSEQKGRGSGGGRPQVGFTRFNVPPGPGLCGSQRLLRPLGPPCLSSWSGGEKAFI